jgi:RNA polymerase sigma-70 factor (ECF subfamily)
MTPTRPTESPDPPTQELFDDLYTRHRGTLHAYFLGRTGDSELALDLLQETFFRVWRGMQSLEALPPEKHRYWLFSIARNLVVDTYRKRGADERAQQRFHEPPAPTQAAERTAEEREQLAEIDTAIRKLPDELREVLVLSVLGERNSTEIGEILGRPPGTVRYQLAQARRRLADDLHAKAEP